MIYLDKKPWNAKYGSKKMKVDILNEFLKANCRLT